MDATWRSVRSRIWSSGCSAGPVRRVAGWPSGWPPRVSGSCSAPATPTAPPRSPPRWPPARRRPRAARRGVGAGRLERRRRRRGRPGDRRRPVRRPRRDAGRARRPAWPARSSSTASSPWASTSWVPYVLDVAEGSVTQQAAALLPDSFVVGAFHHLSAVLLEDLSRPTLDGDVMVVGDVREATDLVQALAGSAAGHARHLRRPAAQRPPGGGADHQPRVGQPAGTRRTPVSASPTSEAGATTSERRTVGSPPRRVVSLVPSLTEAIAATDADLLVGATDWCTHPADLDVPRVGGTKWPDVARVRDAAAGPRRRQRRGEPARGRRGAARGRASRCGSPRRRPSTQALDSLGAAVRRARPTRSGVAVRGPRAPGPTPPRLPDVARRRPDLAAAVDGAGPRHLRRRRARPPRRRQRVRRVRRPLPEAGAR